MASHSGSEIGRGLMQMTPWVAIRVAPFRAGVREGLLAKQRGGEPVHDATYSVMALPRAQVARGGMRVADPPYAYLLHDLFVFVV